MSQFSDIKASQRGFALRDVAARHDTSHPEKYHPSCGHEHHHKPTKAIVGVGLLIVLSCVLYGINAKTPEHSTASSPGLQHNVASNAR